MSHDIDQHPCDAHVEPDRKRPSCKTAVPGSVHRQSAIESGERHRQNSDRQKDVRNENEEVEWTVISPVLLVSHVHMVDYVRHQEERGRTER